MRVELNKGALVYEGKSGFIRRYETNWDSAVRSVMDSLSWAQLHKQPAKQYIVLDIETGRLQVFILEDLENGE